MWKTRNTRLKKPNHYIIKSAILLWGACQCWWHLYTTWSNLSKLFCEVSQFPPFNPNNRTWSNLNVPKLFEIVGCQIWEASWSFSNFHPSIQTTGHDQIWMSWSCFRLLVAKFEKLHEVSQISTLQSKQPDMIKSECPEVVLDCWLPNLRSFMKFLKFPPFNPNN